MPSETTTEPTPETAGGRSADQDTAVQVAVSRFGRRLGVILAVAMLARIGVVVYAEFDRGRFDYPDSRRYINVAHNIAAGNGPIQSASAVGGAAGDARLVLSGTDPLYPGILSLRALVGTCDAGDSGVEAMFRFGRIVNALFGVASVALVGVLGRRLIGPGAGLVAAGMMTVDPITLFFSGLVLTETVYTTLLLAALYCVTRLADDAGRHVAWAAAVGVLLGLSTLTRGSGLLFILFLVPLIWYFRGGLRRGRIVVLLLVFASFAVTLSPAALRNHRLFGHFSPTRVGSGASLLESWGPWADGGPGMERIEYPAFAPDANEYERDRQARDAAVAWARENPGRVAALAWKKLCRTWSVTINAPGYGGGVYAAVGWLTVAPVYGLAVVGFWRLRRLPATLGLLLAPAACYTVIHMVFVGSVRYRMPAMPGLFLVAAAAIVAFRSQSVRPRNSQCQVG